MKNDLYQSASSAYNYPLVIKNLLKQTIKYAPQNEIVYADISRYNYFELNNRVAKLSNLLSQLGVQEGDAVGWIDYDSHRYLEAFYAVPMCGAVLHTVNFRYSPQNIAYTINHAEDVVLFVHSDFMLVIEQIMPQFTSVKKIILLSDSKAPGANFVYDEYEDLLKSQPIKFDFPDFDENLIALTFYTSGTTGQPKGVFFSHRQIVIHAMASMINFGCYEGACRLRSSDVYMPLSPMFHVHSGGFPYVAGLLNVKQVYPGRINPQKILKLIADEGVTFTHTVPTLFNMIVQHENAEKVDLSELKVVIVASAINNSIIQTGEKHGIDVMTSYGMSESCPIISFSFLDKYELLLEMKQQYALRTNVGKPVIFMDLKIIDEYGNDIETTGQKGEIVLRAPWLTKGYNKEKELSEELWVGGWMHTNDIGYVDQDNRITLVDRKRDMIKSGGEWIAPSEIEWYLSLHPNVNSVAVFGIDDQKWGERPVAAVILKNNTENVSELKDFLMTYVAEGKLHKMSMVDQIRVFDNFPKTGTGKIDKKMLKAEWDLKQS